MSVVKARRDLEALATRHGFTFAGITRRMHYKWLHPDGRIVFTGSKLDGSVARRELKNSERRFRSAAFATPTRQ